MMRAACIISAILFSFCCAAQQKPVKKIKIIFLGTWHYGNTTDRNKKSFDDLFTDQRQNELQQLRNKIAAYHPDKIFVENEPSSQPYWDSVYTRYRSKATIAERTMRNEIFQVSIKLAAELGLPRVTCVDFYADKLSDSAYHPADAEEAALMRYLKEIDEVSEKDTALVNQANPKFFNLPTVMNPILTDSFIRTHTILERYRYINTPEYLQNNNYYNWNFFYSLGESNHYLGADYLANKWMGRNMKIFTNILREADLQKDNCYFIMYGATHIPFLKHLFDQHPYFEVVDAEKVLK